VNARAPVAAAAASLLCAGVGFAGHSARAAVPATAQLPVREQSQSAWPRDAPQDVKDVYRDYMQDGVIAVCDHSLSALRRTRASITRAFNRDFPDFRDAVNAGIVRHRQGRCAVHGEPHERVWPFDGHQQSHD
jgi:hypothetical protein